MEIANSVEPVQDGRIHIEKITGAVPSQPWRQPGEYGAGLAIAIERRWLWRHEAGPLSSSRKSGPVCSPEKPSMRLSENQQL
jgi:hypothetical protein